MITHLRIDNRLIHGQVAVMWRSNVSADAIIVCNDKVAADPIQKMALPLACKGEKVLIMTIDELISYDKENPDEKKFVICKYPSDCLELLKKGCTDARNRFQDGDQIDLCHSGRCCDLP